MAEKASDAKYPSQRFGWHVDDDGYLILYAQDGTVAISVAPDGEVVYGSKPAVAGRVLTSDGAGGSQWLPGGGAGSITLVESTDASVVVTGGSGPVVDLSVSGGGGSPFLDREPSGDVTIADHFSGVAVDYYTPSGSLVLDGDAVLLIVEGSPLAVSSVFGATGDVLPQWTADSHGAVVAATDNESSPLTINGSLILAQPIDGDYVLVMRAPTDASDGFYFQPITGVGFFGWSPMGGLDIHAGAGNTSNLLQLDDGDGFQYAFIGPASNGFQLGMKTGESFNVLPSVGDGLTVDDTGVFSEAPFWIARTPIQSDDNSPFGVVDPLKKGAAYFDSANGALYFAIEATNADWIGYGGSSGFTNVAAPGFYVETSAPGNPGQTMIAGHGSVYIGDLTAFPGTSNGIYLNANAGDGSQNVTFLLGSSAQFSHYWGDDGSYVLPSGFKLGADETVPGLAYDGDSVFLLSNGDVGSVNISDTVGLNGTGNCISWITGAADGDQSVRFTLGPSGGLIHLWGTDGSYTLPIPAASPSNATQLGQVSPVGTITSGALPTVSLASGAAWQNTTGRDVDTYTAVTYNSLIATNATNQIQLSPDNSTYSTLTTVTKPVGVAFAGEVGMEHVRVPAGWWLKMTVTQAVLGTTTVV